MNRPAVSFAYRAFATHEDACAELRRFSREGVSVQVSDMNNLEPGEALRLLEFYLHDPHAVEPVDPFSNILSSMLRKQSIGLWDLFPEGSGDGNRDGFLRGLPREHPECLSCRCFLVCEGYGAWSGSCGTWKEIIMEIASAARQLSGRRRRGDSQAGPSGNPLG